MIRQMENKMRQTKGNASALLGAAIQRDNRAMRKAIMYALETGIELSEQLVVMADAVTALRKAAKL